MKNYLLGILSVFCILGFFYTDYIVEKMFWLVPIAYVLVTIVFILDYIEEE